MSFSKTWIHVIKNYIVKITMQFNCLLFKAFM